MKRRALCGLAVFALLLGGEIHAGDGEKDQTLQRFVYVAGTSSALDSDKDLRERLTTYRRTLGTMPVIEGEVRKVPPACGERVLDHFLDQVGDRFAIGGTDSCGSPAARGMAGIECSTTYVRGYDRVSFYLSYERVAESKAKLILEARQRSSTGKVYSASQVLKEEDQHWLRALFKTTVKAVNCGG